MCNLRPESRGNVQIRSADPREQIDTQRGVGLALMYVGEYAQALPYLEQAGIVDLVDQLVRVRHQIIQLVDVRRIHHQLVRVRADHTLRIREMVPVELTHDVLWPIEYFLTAQQRHKAASIEIVRHRRARQIQDSCRRGDSRIHLGSRQLPRSHVGFACVYPTYRYTYVPARLTPQLSRFWRWIG